MNKGELTGKVAEAAEISKNKATIAVNTAIEGIRDSLSSGERVVLVGLGTFSIRERAARTGRNPRTGATLNIPAKKVPVFKAGKELKDAVA